MPGTINSINQLWAGVRRVRNTGTDCTGPIINAMNAAAAGGGVVVFDPDYYPCLSSLGAIPVGVSLMGTRLSGSSAPGQSYATADPTTFGNTTIGVGWGGNGTSATSQPFLAGNNFTTIQGLTFWDSVQGAAGTSRRPYVIGTTYQAPSDTMAVLDCAFLNADQGVRIWGAGRNRVENCFFCCLSNAIWVDQQGDTTRLSKLAVVPTSYFQTNSGGGLTAAAQAVQNYIQANLIAYRFGRVDGLSMTDCMVYLASTGILCEPSSQNTAPNVSWISASNIALDVCDVCLDLQATAYQGVNIVGGSLTTPPRGTTPNGIGVRIGQAAGKVRLVGLGISSQSGQEVRMAGGDVIVSGCHLNSIGQTGTDSSPSILNTATVPSYLREDCSYEDNRPTVSWQSTQGNFKSTGFAYGGSSATVIDPNNRRVS